MNNTIYIEINSTPTTPRRLTVLLHTSGVKRDMAVLGFTFWFAKGRCHVGTKWFGCVCVRFLSL